MTEAQQMPTGKVSSVVARHDLVLQAAVATEMGIVESAHDSGEEVLDVAMCRGEELAKRRWSGKAYAGIRKALYLEGFAPSLPARLLPAVAVSSSVLLIEFAMSELPLDGNTAPDFEAKAVFD
ncbi:hypothetical protein BUALT_Bualt01G0102100 [Buddleja alternifolia]|uniref:Uncharacterized protein n=1 Tax=Buddleja alternifolia TaxID=168488 RepID=A0AAV6YEG7_9LAMI|nr:hypothetical protein BUALT_Bualt01G0102100 [Buddleja alternifolia]